MTKDNTPLSPRTTRFVDVSCRPGHAWQTSQSAYLTQPQQRKPTKSSLLSRRPPTQTKPVKPLHSLLSPVKNVWKSNVLGIWFLPLLEGHGCTGGEETEVWLQPDLLLERWGKSFLHLIFRGKWCSLLLRWFGLTCRGAQVPRNHGNQFQRTGALVQGWGRGCEWVIGNHAVLGGDLSQSTSDAHRKGWESQGASLGLRSELGLIASTVKSSCLRLLSLGWIGVGLLLTGSSDFLRVPKLGNSAENVSLCQGKCFN